MISVTDQPLPRSVFTPTRMSGIVERFHSISMRSDMPPCEYVEADFDGVNATVCDLGEGDGGEMRRECQILAGGVICDFSSLELNGSVPDSSSFGAHIVEKRTIERIRRWSIGHGMDDFGPAVTETRISAMERTA